MILCKIKLLYFIEEVYKINGNNLLKKFVSPI